MMDKEHVKWVLNDRYFIGKEGKVMAGGKA